MRVVEVDRSVLRAGPLALGVGEFAEPDDVVAVLDRLGVSDGLPFVVDDDGTFAGCDYLNRYLFDAHAQGGLDVGSMRRFHVYHLARMLRFLRRRRVERAAAEAGIEVEAWLAAHGEVRLDLTAATRADLLAYRDSRALVLAASTLSTEMGCISGFFRYATESGWVGEDPVPRWAGRNTLMPRNRRRRIARFLSAEQTKHFLEAGLRGDGAPAESRPASPERDYCYALVLATTGLRRAEGALLLDCEIPEAHRIPGEGVHAFPRTGKLGVTRTIYVTLDLARALDLYRRVERGPWVERAQPTLRRMRREGRLFLVDSVSTHRGRPCVSVAGHRVPAERLTDEQRARAAYVADDGHIEPLALFVSARGGLAPGNEYWNELFAAARDRVAALGDAHRPPEHITVSPHTMRHTFAVRMLHALMREGQERAGNPYYLLANPVMTVKDLLGHASMSTVHDYLFAAETWTQEVPLALRRTTAEVIGRTSSEPEQPGQASE